MLFWRLTGYLACRFILGMTDFSGGYSLSLVKNGEIGHGFTYADEALREAEKGHMSVPFHHVVIKRGVIEFLGPEEIPDRDRRILHKMPVKPFGEASGNFSSLAEFAGEEVAE